MKRATLIFLLTILAPAALALPREYNPIKTDAVNLINSQAGIQHRRIRIYVTTDTVHTTGALTFTDGYGTATLAELMSTEMTATSASVALIALWAENSTDSVYATSATVATWANYSTAALTASDATTATWAERGLRVVVPGTVDSGVDLGDVCELTAGDLWELATTGTSRLLGVYWAAGSPAWFVVCGEATAECTTTGLSPGDPLYLSSEGALSASSTTGSRFCGYALETPTQTGARILASVHFEPDVGTGDASGEMGMHTHDASAIISGTFDADRIPAEIARDAEITADIATHAAIAAAHHWRVTWAGDVYGWILANDGVGSGIDTDLFQGYDVTDFAAVLHYHSASEITGGTLSTDRYSAYADLTAEGKLDGGGGDLLKVGDSFGGDMAGTLPTAVFSRVDDADGDTYVDVEATADSDYIVFGVEHSEVMLIHGGATPNVIAPRILLYSGTTPNSHVFSPLSLRRQDTGGATCASPTVIGSGDNAGFVAVTVGEKYVMPLDNPRFWVVSWARIILNATVATNVTVTAGVKTYNSLTGATTVYVDQATPFGGAGTQRLSFILGVPYSSQCSYWFYLSIDGTSLSGYIRAISLETYQWPWP